MKKLSAIFCLLLSGILAFASPVSREEARRVASAFFADGSRLSDCSAAPDGIYVFNRAGGGFVIVSSDDSAIPVLAYSFDGSFTLAGAPDNLGAWAENTSRVLRHQAGKLRRQSSGLQALWDNPVSVRSKSGEVLIETATWNQKAPFNYYSPDVDGQKSIAGCVPVAMAIIMRHFSWPASGVGSLPSYTYKTDKGNSRTQPGHSLGHSYDWDNMPLHHVPEDNRAVAQLIYDCGIMVQAYYNPKGTSAYTGDAPNAMVAHMSYSKAALMQNRSYFSTSVWFSKVKASLDGGIPLLYSATSSGDYGHAFVVDGYDEDYRLHVNWGWGGECNGWFALDCFFPYTDISKEEEYGYYYSHGAVFWLVPDKDASSDYTPYLCLRRHGDRKGILVDRGRVAAGENFELSFGLCTNSGLSNYTGAVAVALEDANSNFIQLIGEEVAVEDLEPGYGGIITEYEGELPATVGLGCRIRPYYKAGADWVPMFGNSDEAVVSSLPAGPDVYFIETDYAYFSGEKLQLKLCNGSTAYSSVKWYFDGTECPGAVTAPLEKGQHCIKAVITFPDGMVETICQDLMAR
ncbi:MAG: C10 family peptidase [Bacteroidales bacterium]|nr:C10 family peptidase [Bacteroidales bacterium]